MTNAPLNDPTQANRSRLLRAVWIDSASVSIRLARILVEGDHVFLEDLGIKNGTFFRG
jgi:hypothetical protein